MSELFFSEYELDNVLQPDAVERLAKFMGAAGERRTGESKNSYQNRCKRAILRVDKANSRVSKAKRARSV